MTDILVYDDTEQRLQRISDATDMTIAELIDGLLDEYISDDAIIRDFTWQR